MIMREEEFVPRSQPPATIKKSLPSVQTKVSAPKANTSFSKVFDATRILHRYRELRDNQHEKLAAINLSQDLKKQLFGFSEQHYLTNQIKVSDLVIQNHPLDGRLIMTKKQYQIYLNEKQQEKELKQSKIMSLSNQRKQSNLFEIISVSSLNDKKLMQMSQGDFLKHHRSQQT